MILEALVPDCNYLLSSGRHSNTSALLCNLTHKQLKLNRTVTIVHHFGESSVHHYDTLLAKSGVNVSEVKESGKLKYSELNCLLHTPPHLDNNSDNPEWLKKVEENQVVVLTEIHLLLGLGCQLKDVVMLVQRLLRDGLIVIVTSRDSPETKQLNTYLESLLGNCVSVDTLNSGASKEVDGHMTRRSTGVVSTGLYKGSERGLKVFPLGTAPGTV